jgi:hypothetical protein
MEAASMAVAFVQEFKIDGDDRSTTNYDAVSARLDVSADPPAGLIVHTAGFDEASGVFRIFDVWESREHGDTFWRERLQPTLDELTGSMENASPPDRESWYELHDSSSG